MKFSEMTQLASLDHGLQELRKNFDSIPPEYLEKPQLFSPRPGGSTGLRPQGTEPRASASGATGPRTPEGKAISSLNALRTGLTGRTVLLSSDDAAAYASHIENYRAEYSPVGLRETELVQSLADTSWRLRRIPGLEMAIYAQGRCEFAGCFDAHDPSLRAGMIELQTHLKYEKQLRNLQIQESRLTRRYANEAKELRDLQSQRKERREATVGDCPKTFIPATSARTAREFEFSTAQTGDCGAQKEVAPQKSAASSSASEHQKAA
jgi:hypothetical protein